MEPAALWFGLDLARPDGVEAEFRRLYYDTANATHPASMAALTSRGMSPQFPAAMPREAAAPSERIGMGIFTSR